MRIDTERLHLRPVTENDVDLLHRMWTDPEVRRYLWDDRVIEREVAEEVVAATVRDWREHGYGFWIVELDAIPIGFTGFRSSEGDERPELLYAFLPPYWKRGYATEASCAALEFLRDRGVHAVRAATDPPNVASVAVMERIGMTFEKRGVLNGLDTLFFRIG